MYGAMPARFLVILGMGAIARAVLHATLAVDKAGKPKADTPKVSKLKEAWPDVPIIPAVGAEMEAVSEAFRGGGQRREEETCTPLKSVFGTVYTVSVHVGTPEQVLDVVVDTGSNLLVVESCKCRDRGYCNPLNKCLREPASSTLVVDQGREGPTQAVLNYGSGSILTEVASDNVRIGSTSTNMEHGVLLMVDQLLDFGGPFEGIVGLGLPNPKDGPLALRIAEHKNFFDKYLHDAKSSPATVRMSIGHSEETFVPIPLPMGVRNASSDKAWRRAAPEPEESSLDTEVVTSGTQVLPKLGGGFVRQAGIGRFSICFTDSPAEAKEADGGVLRFDPPEAPERLKSIGTMHWGLDFRGISVGDSETKLSFCSEASMPPQQQTPCGAIPDSGTTYIMGPADQIDTLFEEICDQWPRCSSNYTKMTSAAEAAQKVVEETYGIDPWGIKPMSKVTVFRMLMQDCDSWLDEAMGMNDLPPIHFHVADDTGLTKALTLDGQSYTVSIKEPEVKQITQYIPGIGEVPVGQQETGRVIWMCQAAFSGLNYPTEKNGQAWIIGMPVFHRYIVGFNVAVEPPTISFTEGQCGDCGGDGAALLGRDVALASGSRSVRRPRRVMGSPRIPKIDTTQPF